MKKKRVIVVEENDITMKIYKLIFKKYLPTVDVEYITNAEEALERVTKNHFDLLITDYNLKHKDINGVDLARLVYPLGKPVMLASCHRIIPRMLLWLKYWDMCYRIKFINKPFEVKSMVKNIQKQLDKETIPLHTMFKHICP